MAEALLRAYPFIPYSRHPGIGRDEAVDAFLSSVEAADYRLDDEQGIVAWSALSWDSEILGWRCGRVDALVARNGQARTRLVSQVVDATEECGICYLTARVPAGDIGAIHALENAGFITVDAVVTLARTFPADDLTVEGGVECRTATENDGDALAEIARRAYRVDRFHSDPLVSQNRADAVFDRWLRSSVDGAAADAVIVGEDGTGPVAFATCQLVEGWDGRLATIPLVAAAQPGAGHGRAVLVAVLSWCNARGATVADVGTQLANIPALRLYENCGFRAVASSVTLRRWQCV